MLDLHSCRNVLILLECLRMGCACGCGSALLWQEQAPEQLWWDERIAQKIRNAQRVCVSLLSGFDASGARLPRQDLLEPCNDL